MAYSAEPDLTAYTREPARVSRVQLVFGVLCILAGLLTLGAVYALTYADAVAVYFSQPPPWVGYAGIASIGLGLLLCFVIRQRPRPW